MAALGVASLDHLRAKTGTAIRQQTNLRILNAKVILQIPEIFLFQRSSYREMATGHCNGGD